MQNKTDQGTIKRRQRTSPSNWNAHCTETSHRYIKIHTWLRGLGYLGIWSIKNPFPHVQRDKRIVVNCHCVDYIIIFE